MKHRTDIDSLIHLQTILNVRENIIYPIFDKYYKALKKQSKKEISTFSEILSASRLTTSEENLLEGINLLATSNNQDLLSLEFFNQVPETDHIYIKTLFYKSLGLIRLNKYKQAFVALSKIIENNPNFKEPYLYIGICGYNLNISQDEILKYFDQALKIDPNYKEVSRQKVIYLTKWNKFTEAIETNDKALSLDIFDEENWKIRRDIFNNILQVSKKEYKFSTRINMYKEQFDITTQSLKLVQNFNEFKTKNYNYKSSLNKQCALLNQALRLRRLDDLKFSVIEFLLNAKPNFLYIYEIKKPNSAKNIYLELLSCCNPNNKKLLNDITLRLYNFLDSNAKLIQTNYPTSSVLWYLESNYISDKETFKDVALKSLQNENFAIYQGIKKLDLDDINKDLKVEKRQHTYKSPIIISKHAISFSKFFKDKEEALARI